MKLVNSDGLDACKQVGYAFQVVKELFMKYCIIESFILFYVKN